MENLENTELYLRTQTLAQLIINTADQYYNSSESQKSLLETLIGAGIWYLPSHGVNLFSGKISIQAMISLEIDPYTTKLVEEHGIPRKVAGRLLYTTYLEDLKKNPDLLRELYVEKFGRFNLVLSEENRSLMRYQRVDQFINEEAAYQQAGIQLMDFSEENYREYKILRRMGRIRNSVPSSNGNT